LENIFHIIQKYILKPGKKKKAMQNRKENSILFTRPTAIQIEKRLFIYFLKVCAIRGRAT
jgi:hypothetical protein